MLATMGWRVPPPPLLWSGNKTGSLRVHLYRPPEKTPEEHELAVSAVVKDVASAFPSIDVRRYGNQATLDYVEIILRKVALDPAVIDSVMNFCSQSLQYYSYPPPLPLAHPAMDRTHPPPPAASSVQKQ
jgi:hypothetical protein